MRRLTYAFVSLLTLCAGVAPADTLVLTDGRRVVGEVGTQDDETFVVRQGDKRVTVKANDVSDWIVGDAAPVEKADPVVAADDPAETPAPATDDGAPAGATSPVNASVERDAPAAAVQRRTVRRNERAVAFPVATDLLVTSAAVAVGGVESQLLTRDGDEVEFEVVRDDGQLALLRVKGKQLAPLKLAESFETARINAGGEVRVCGYTEPGLFQPTLTFIKCKADRPSAKGPWKVAADANPVSPGGPILCGDEVVGVQLATDRSRPDAIAAVTLESLRKFVGDDATPATGRSDPAVVSMQLTVTHDREEIVR